MLRGCYCTLRAVKNVVGRRSERKHHDTTDVLYSWQRLVGALAMSCERLERRSVSAWWLLMGDPGIWVAAYVAGGWLDQSTMPVALVYVYPYSAIKAELLTNAF